MSTVESVAVVIALNSEGVGKKKSIAPSLFKDRFPDGHGRVTFDNVRLATFGIEKRVPGKRKVKEYNRKQSNAANCWN